MSDSDRNRQVRGDGDGNREPEASEPEASEPEVLVRWLLPGVLAGGPHPSPWGDPEEAARAARQLRSAGVGAVITLVERPLVLPGGGDLELLHAPTLDGEAPDDLEALCSFIDGQKLRGRATFVHCAAGQGRTGTVLAAYLIWSQGRRAWDAIEHVRANYHRLAVETPAQHDALLVFEQRHRLL